MHRALFLSKDSYDFQNIVLVDSRLPLLLIMKYKAVTKGEEEKGQMYTKVTSYNKSIVNPQNTHNTQYLDTEIIIIYMYY